MKGTRDHQPGDLNLRDVRRRFDRAAASFDRVDFVHRHAARGMLERMAPMRIDAGCILDAGAAAGDASRELARRFRRSRVISLDASTEMLRQSRRKRSRFGRIREVQADAQCLPFRSGSVDLVFANMLLPWIDDAPRFFDSVARVLRVDGLFVFSALGPDSLRELRDAWRDIDEREHVNAFRDMHDVGDSLVQAGLREPVLDVDHLTVTYDDPPSLFADLTAVGGRNSLRGRGNSLTSRARFATLGQNLAGRFADGKLRLRLELVFGHAWGGGPRQPAGEFALDVGAIGRRHH